MKKELVLTLAIGASLVTLGTVAAAMKPCDPCGAVQPCDDADFDPCQLASPKSDAFRLTPRGSQLCDPCEPASCDPCDPICDLDDDDLSCDSDLTCRPEKSLGPCDESDCSLPLKKKRRSSQLSVYGSAAAMIGNFDAGYFRNRDDSKLGFQIGGGVKAVVGIARGKHAVEASYKGLFASKSTSWYGLDTEGRNPFQRVHVENDFQAGDVSCVINLERLPSIKILAGAGYSNFNVKADWFKSNGDPLSTDKIKNDLIGVHLGGKWSRNIGRRLGIEASSKIGVYANTVGVDLNVGDPNAQSGSYGNCCGAWGASCGIDFTYKVSRCVTSFIGYDFTMIDGVERGGFAVKDIIERRTPPGNPVVPNARDLATDRMIAQGLTFGLKCNY